MLEIIKRSPHLMDNLPLVSIITPTFNQAIYLAETIDSVLGQDYPFIEYIVIDDGSTDETIKVLRQYDGRICWEYHDNIGQARTLNKGWDMSSGSIIGYISSDDLLNPQAVSKAVSIFVTNPNVVVTYSDFELIDNHGRSFKRIKTEEFNTERLTQQLVCQPGPGAFFRRGLLAECGGWNPNLRQVPDFEFWLRVAKKGQFVRIDQSLASFRVHEESTSFRPVTSDRSNEIINVMQIYWGDNFSFSSQKSLSQAFILAAKSHAQSGRFLIAIKYFVIAVKTNWKVIVSVEAWRTILSGFFRRIYYSFVLNKMR